MRVSSSEDEIKGIAKVLFDFKRTRQPGQPAILKGREREGKTGALFSIALAAIILRMRVVILCAPNKVAPVVDMVKKSEQLALENTGMCVTPWGEGRSWTTISLHRM